MNSNDCFNNLLRIKCTNLCSNSFRFDISIVRCLGGYFFSGRSAHYLCRCSFIELNHTIAVVQSQLNYMITVRYFQVWKMKMIICITVALLLH